MLLKGNKLKTFLSKRNKVYLYEYKDRSGFYVFKSFEDDKHYCVERDVYDKLKASHLSPGILRADDEHKSLAIEYIDGVTALEQLEIYEKSNDHTLALNLLMLILDWLVDFYGYFECDGESMALHDLNLRNFIVKDEKVYGIDFECCDRGENKVELIRLIAMYGQYDPVDSNFKEKVIKELYLKFYRSYGYGEEEFKTMLASEIEVILKRRRNKGL